jgi:site-specific recombinase
MKQSSIAAIRNPFEPAFTRHLAHAGFRRRLQISLLDRLRPSFEHHSQLRSSEIFTTDGTLGVSATGNLNSRTIAQILAALPGSGVFELVCHPGYNDADLDRITTRLRAHREIEIEALESVLPSQLSQPNAPELIHYGSLVASQPINNGQR